MIFLSIMDLGPFLAFFSLWVLFFVIEYKVLKMEYEDEEYKALNSFTQMLIITIRNSIGDIQMPKYTKWID